MGVDVAAQLAGEVSDGSEDSACDDLTLDFGEPEFDLIQPRGIRGREVKMDPRMLLQKRMYQGSLVSREVFENDVDLLPGRAQGDDFRQESNEVLARVASGGFSMHPTGGRFQRGIEGQCAMR